MNQSYLADTNDVQTQIRFQTIQRNLRQRSNRLMNYLLPTQWIVFAGIWLGLGYAAETDGNTVFATPISGLLATIGLVTLAQMIAFRIYRVQVNKNLFQMCYHQSQLEQANRDAEQLIWERTKDQKAANRQLKLEVNRRVKAETECEHLTRKLLHAARQAGKSEIATGVLHSVGSTVTAIKAAADDALGYLDTHRNDRLDEAIARTAQLSTGHSESQPLDEKINQLAEILSAAARQNTDQREVINNGLRSICTGAAYITETVAIQQSYSRVGCVAEKFSLAELCEEAINIFRADLTSHAIEIVREYDDIPATWTERNRILQILVNLLTNAKQAVLHPEATERKIRIGTSLDESGLLTIAVTDHGVGVSPEILPELFQHGFTNRPDGNGFGLHASLQMAHELNGNLVCIDTAPGQGTTFALTLPLAEDDEHRWHSRSSSAESLIRPTRRRRSENAV